MTNTLELRLSEVKPPSTGAVTPARNRHDVSQALSWVATQRSNPEKRLELQAQIADLLEKLKDGQPADDAPFAPMSSVGLGRPNINPARPGHRPATRRCRSQWNMAQNTGSSIIDTERRYAVAA